MAECRNPNSLKPHEQRRLDRLARIAIREDELGHHIVGSAPRAPVGDPCTWCGDPVIASRPHCFHVVYDHPRPTRRQVWHLACPAPDEHALRRASA